MTQTYILVDTANTFFRARHAIRGDLNDKIGMSIHTVLSSVRKAWRDFKGDHVIFFLEGRSWRKDYYAPYKRQRSDARAAASPREQEEDRVFWETFDQFKGFINELTNCTVLQHQQLEADDLIAGWIQNHPNDNHIIISTDGDFAQLIAPNVKQYNGVMEITTTHEGYFDAKGKRVIDKKTKQEKAAPDPAWLLFEKCMRGDTSDNIFSAYPGVREKGTKNKVGLREAFGDRDRQGYNWNNMMLQRWLDHDGIEHRVLDDYERNRTLIDLTAQPDEIKQQVDSAIAEQISHRDVGQVGVRFMQFCGKYELNKCSDAADQFGRWMNETYKGILNL